MLERWNSRGPAALNGVMHLPEGASKRYDSKASGLLLGTAEVDVVVKATVPRAGQIAAATENRIAEPAPSTAETSAGSSLFRSSEEPQHNVKGSSGQQEDHAEYIIRRASNHAPAKALLSQHLART